MQPQDQGCFDERVNHVNICYDHLSPDLNLRIWQGPGHLEGSWWNCSSLANFMVGFLFICQLSVDRKTKWKGVSVNAATGIRNVAYKGKTVCSYNACAIVEMKDGLHVWEIRSWPVSTNTVISLVLRGRDEVFPDELLSLDLYPRRPRGSDKMTCSHRGRSYLDSRLKKGAEIDVNPPDTVSSVPGKTCRRYKCWLAWDNHVCFYTETILTFN